jgi:hypothetical protein
MRVGDQAVANASEQQVVKQPVLVGSEHDQIGFQTAGFRQDLLGRIALNQE